MRCPKCGKPLVCAACAGSVGGAARVAKGFASAEVQAKAQATRKRKARAAHDSHNPTGEGRRESETNQKKG
jgi:hypothetical protein